ncbi:MAG TPA: hypothetical protein VGL51_17390 [Solirubrobacteraceae bacterium]
MAALVAVPGQAAATVLVAAPGQAAASVLVAGPGQAAAAVSRFPSASLPGPRFMSTGLVDDSAFEGPVPATRTTWLRRARQLGSSWVRLGVYWQDIAPPALSPGFRASDPSDPRYNWSYLDAAVRDATASGERVVLTLFHPPAWALGSHAPRSVIPGTWRPRATTLGAFARAVAQRYSGHFADPQLPGRDLPRVSYFQAWNEPNLPSSISPQWTRRRRAWVPASPGIYRRLLNAVYANVKRIQPKAYILAAGTAPYGDRPGGARMRPVTFVRELLCLHGAALRKGRCPDPAHFNALDHHPYALTPTIHAFNPGDVSVPDIGKLKRILRAAERTRRALPSGPKPIWITEIDWTSRPPDHAGIPLARQARYLSLAFYQLWRQGVAHVFWYLIHDIPFRSLTGAGVYFGDGRPKPSAAAFRFPFAVVPGTGRMLTVWGDAPRAGMVTIERRKGRAWRALTRVRTTPDGIFYVRRRLSSKLILRARIDGGATLVWTPR